MTDPNAQDDDTWDELARELGLDEPTPRAPTSDPLEAEEGEPIVEELEDVGLAEGESELDTEDGEEAEESEAEGTGEGPPGEGQPGTGRKRRRRRRRRKKGGVGAAAPVGEAEEPGEPVGVTEEEPEEAEDYEVTARITEEGMVEGDEEAEEIEPAGAPLAAEEDTGSEVLRDLIANWNVPSWDDIIAGLYRPDR